MRVTVSRRASMSRYPDAEVVRRLLLHEARVHASSSRTLRDLGDALLLTDPVDPDPFWNRLEAARWPREPEAFDRRLAEVAVLFATLGRQPHVWVSPPHDEPRDLAARLEANGFQDVGEGLLMVAQDAAAARATLERGLGPGATVERLRRLRGPEASAAAGEIVAVLLTSFAVEAERGPGIVAETLSSLADDRFTHYLVRLDGAPVAVARRATFDGLSYLSSIGTVERARGRGFGRYVTAVAMVDAIGAGSEWIHLGVFADNPVAIALYEGLGFRMSGEPGPDMVLIG
jgi:ribosomal protein S18 acetylase RimI-like enzyme